MRNCPECESLSQVFESKQTGYFAARYALLYQISTEFAAKQQVDMERAKNDVEEHLLTCPFAARVKCLALLPLQESSALWRPRL